jgi:hypothetical protein
MSRLTNVRGGCEARKARSANRLGCEQIGAELSSARCLQSRSTPSIPKTNQCAPPARRRASHAKVFLSSVAGQTTSDLEIRRQVMAWSEPRQGSPASIVPRSKREAHTNHSANYSLTMLAVDHASANKGRFVRSVLVAGHRSSDWRMRRRNDRDRCSGTKPSAAAATKASRTHTEFVGSQSDDILLLVRR